MEFSDVLVKIATNQTLTPEELDFLKRTGTETQLRNSKVAGWTAADGSFSADTITANRIQIGKELYLGVVARYYNAAWTATTSAWTNIPSWTADYEDFGFYTSGASIFIPIKGKYLVQFSMILDVGSNGIRIAQLYGVAGGYPPYDIRTAVSGNICILTAFSEVDFEAGDSTVLRAWHNEGSDLAATNTWVTFRKIR